MIGLPKCVEKQEFNQVRQEKLLWVLSWCEFHWLGLSANFCFPSAYNLISNFKRTLSSNFPCIKYIPQVFLKLLKWWGQTDSITQDSSPLSSDNCFLWFSPTSFFQGSLEGWGWVSIRITVLGGAFSKPCMPLPYIWCSTSQPTPTP